MAPAKLELSNMKKQGVWEVVKKSQMPPGCTPIGCKCIFKIKAVGMHQARLVTQGFSQIPGIDFMENFTLVLKDETLCILLVYLIIKKAESEQINVGMAFL